MGIVAIIDDGVNPAAYPFIGGLYKSLLLTEDDSVMEVQESSSERKTHGTFCAAIIKKYAPTAELISIKVIDPDRGKGTAQKVKIALEWCISNHVPLINLSIGSTCMAEQEIFRSVISRLIRENITLVCAMSNDERFSTLTDYTGVISVQQGVGVFEDQFYSRRSDLFCSDFFASSVHSFQVDENHAEYLSSQNSHAAPVMTAHIYQFIEKNGVQLLGRVYRHLSNRQLFRLKSLPDFLDTAVCFGKPIWNSELFSFTANFFKEKFPDESFFCSIFPDDNLNLYILEQELSRYKQFIRGILYAGYAPPSLKRLCEEIGCLFWDESEYIKHIYQLSICSQEVIIPAVFLNGSDTRVAKIAQKFCNFLLEDGYRVKLFSDLPQSYCGGMVYLPKEIDSSSYIRQFIEVYQLDIVLICGNSSVFLPDLSVALENDKVILNDEYQLEIWSGKVTDESSLFCQIREVLS